MDVAICEDVAFFTCAAADFLRQERFSANVVSVEAGAVLDGVRPERPGSIWILVSDAGTVVGAAMHTPPFALFLPRLPAGAPDAIAAALRGPGRRLPGVTGERRSVEAFLSAWGDDGAELRRAMRMYVLGLLRPPEGVAGAARPAVETDAALAARWFRAFHAESQPDAPGADLATEARQRIAARGLHLWECEDRVVSLAGVTAAAAGVARIGPVYTPPEHRRHGFGAAVTATASAAATAAGAEDVILYTDQANPVSNSIYRAIGYGADHDAAEYAFGA